MKTRLLFIVLCLMSGQARSADSSSLPPFLDVEYLAAEVSQFEPKRRDPYLLERTGDWAKKAALRWDVSILGAGYWRNNVHTETIKSGAVKTVGWQWELGFRLGKYVEVFHQHHSRHVMEEEAQLAKTNPGNIFPVEDSYGVRFIFFSKGR